MPQSSPYVPRADAGRQVIRASGCRGVGFTRGNVYVSGPGGIQLFPPSGKHLGAIRTPQHAHNFAWGDDDGRTLYLAARSRLYRMRLGIPGVRP